MNTIRGFGILLCLVQIALCHHHDDHFHPGPIDCAEILKGGNNESKIYRLWPLNWAQCGSFLAYCDMETEGGGWTIFQRRGDFNSPSQFFDKKWKDYKRGFGRLDKDFWLGNDRIFSLTNQGNYTLRIEFTTDDKQRRSITYRKFWIESSDYGYKIHLSGFSGINGYSLNYANEQEFYTHDTSEDKKECAKFKGGWWFSDCSDSNIFYLNGPYSPASKEANSQGTGYFPDAEMKIRPQNFR